MVLSTWLHYSFSKSYLILYSRQATDLSVPAGPHNQSRLLLRSRHNADQQLHHINRRYLSVSTKKMVFLKTFLIKFSIDPLKALTCRKTPVHSSRDRLRVLSVRTLSNGSKNCACCGFTIPCVIAPRSCCIRAYIIHTRLGMPTINHHKYRNDNKLWYF